MKIFSLPLVAAALALTACSSSDDAAVYQRTAAGAAFKTANTAALSLSSLGPATATRAMSIEPRTLGLTAFWSTDNTIGFNDGRQDPSPPVTLKEYMGIQFQSNAARPDNSSINVFGRLRHSGSIICLVTNLLSASTSAEAAAQGSATAVFTPAVIAFMTTECGFAATELSGLPTSFPLTLSAPATTTIFDLKISISLDGEDQVMFAKWGGADGIIAFASNEDNSNGRTRTVVIYNSNTKILKGEYLAKSKIDGYGMSIDRLWKDDNTGQGRIVSVWNQNYANATATSPTATLRYIVDGSTASTATHLSLGISFSGYSGQNGTYEACVRKADGNSVDATESSGNFTCSNTGGIGGRTTAAVNALVSDFTTKTTLVTPTWHELPDSPNLSWTSSTDMLTNNVESP